MDLVVGEKGASMKTMKMTGARLPGVLGVDNILEVRLPSISQHSEPEIARDAVAAVRDEGADLGDIKVVVMEGLDGR